MSEAPKHGCGGDVVRRHEPGATHEVWKLGPHTYCSRDMPGATKVTEPVWHPESWRCTRCGAMGPDFGQWASGKMVEEWT